MARFKRKKPDISRYRNSKNKNNREKETNTGWKKEYSPATQIQPVGARKLYSSATKSKNPSIDSVITDWTSGQPKYKTAHIADVNSISMLCEKFINMNIYAEINKTKTGFSCRLIRAGPTAATKMKKAKKEYLNLEK